MSVAKLKRRAQVLTVKVLQELILKLRDLGFYNNSVSNSPYSIVAFLQADGGIFRLLTPLLQENRHQQGTSPLGATFQKKLPVPFFSSQKKSSGSSLIDRIISSTLSEVLLEVSISQWCMAAHGGWSCRTVAWPPLPLEYSYFLLTGNANVMEDDPTVWSRLL